MIVQFLIDVGANVAEWFGRQFPDWEVPPFLVNFDTTVNDVLSQLDGVAVWADWPYILGIVGAVVAVWLIAFLLKLARAVASYIPFVGGSG